MTKPRELVAGDRVKIIGTWCLDADEDEGQRYIGNNATVMCIAPHRYMPIQIQIDNRLASDYLWWCRENLRALPRKVR